MADDSSASNRRDPIKSSVGNVAGQRRRQQAVTVAKERRESLVRAKRLCRVGTNGCDDEDAHVENEMMVDEDQTVLEAQTSKAVEELKSAVQSQGKGAMQKRVAALRELRRLLSKSEFPPIEAALSAGAIPLLVQCLSFGSPDEQLLESAWCLTNMAAGKPEETKALLPALPLLIAHLGEKSSAPVAEQCAWAIGNVAGEGEELRNVLLSQGALPPLARMIFPDKGSTVRTAAWALSNLIKGPESKAAAQLVRVDGIVEAILRHLKKTDEEIATEIAWIVVYLSALSDIATSMLLKGGILQLLVERLATSNSLQLLIPVLRSLGNFVSVDPKAMLTILIGGQNTEENVIGVLAKCLRSEHRVLKKEAAWVLSNIAAGSIEHKRMIHSTEAMPLLLRLLSTSPFDIRKEAAYVLGNLCVESAEGKKQEWQNKLKNLRIGRKEVVEDKDKAEDSTMLAPFYDQNSLILKAQEQEAKASDVGNLVQVLNAVDVNSIPRASIVKQLAVAIEAGKLAKTMKEFAASSGSSSPVRERGGLSLSAVKSMVLGEKEDKLGFDSRDEEKLVSLINSMFNVDGNFLVRMIVSDLESPTNRASFAKDLHVAPPNSFVVKLAEVIGSFTTPSRMALFWCRVVDELRRFWNEKKHIPWIPLDENPDLKSCLLHQWLQVINCCLARKARFIAASEALDAVMSQASLANEKSDISEAMGTPASLLYAKNNTGELILRLGVHHQVQNLTMLETGEPVYAPITQEGPLLTEDLIKETEELVLRTGSMGAGCSQLLSDMQAFKAANPGCILEDFVRWHSPPDWTENDTSSGDDSSPLRGQLSIRMQKEGNLWRELWETAKPLPAVKQTPLYDEDLAVEGILNSLEDIPPAEFFEQLFVSLVALGFVMVEPVVAANDDLSKLFFECKDYVVATCQGDAWTDKLDDLCQVYETAETMLVHPEKVLRSMKQTEESPSGGNETKRRFRRLSFIFRGKEGNKKRVPSETEQKSTGPSPRQSFSSLFDGKSSLFAKKPPRPAENGTLV